MDVLVVVEGVVRVVLGLDFGESPVDLVAVGLPDPAGVVVGIKEVDVDAASAVRWRAWRNRFAQVVSAAACSPDWSGSHTASMMMLWATSRPA
jgi:hypothetical protein